MLAMRGLDIFTAATTVFLITGAAKCYRHATSVYVNQFPSFCGTLEKVLLSCDSGNAV